GRRAGLVQAPPPPQVEVRRLRDIRAIIVQLIQWQVKPGHSSLRPVKEPESSPTIFLVTADPGARGDQWRRVPGVYVNRGPASSGGNDPPQTPPAHGGGRPPHTPPATPGSWRRDARRRDVHRWDGR